MNALGTALSDRFESIEHLSSTPINWRRIEKHHPDFIRLALAIHSGKLAPSAVLARIKSHTSRDPFSLALQELGCAVRTAFVLRWTSDERLRRDVHKGTTKVERSHQFTKYLNFGGEGGMMRTNNPADQEKAMVYNELVANAVALQTVADQTDALHELRRRGIDIPAEDLTHFSPYPTSKVKRFGEYPPVIKTATRPPNRHLPPRTQTSLAPAVSTRRHPLTELLPGIECVDGMTRKILDVARGHGQMMMKRCGGQQSIDHRQGRALALRIAGEFAPVIGHGRIDRQQTAGKSARQLNVEPHLKVHSTLTHFEHSQALADFSQGQHTQEKQRLVH